MKYDFKELAFIIHLRVDVPERLRNLEVVLEYYNKTCKNLEFIIVNDDAKPESKLKYFYDKYKNIKVLFLKNNSYHNKSLSLNSAFKETSRKIIIAHDTDVIIDPKHILEGADNILNGKSDHVYPYNGLFCTVKDNLVQKFKNSLDVNTFLSNKPTSKNLINCYENNYIFINSTESCGGCVMYSSDIYKKVNGYNPKFIGWGYEDDEMASRVKKFNAMTSRVSDKDAIAWHMPHPNSIRGNNPYIDQNHKLVTYTQSATLEELQKYIKEWKL